MKRLIFRGMTLVTIFVITAVGNVEAGLFSNLTTDRRAHHVGDLITIVVDEEAVASQNASTQAGKTGSISVGPGLGVLDFLPLVKASGTDGMKSSGVTSRGGTVQTTVTVRVTEVLPNGILRIEGTRKFTLNGEHQEITLTGLVRPEDVDRDNRVHSRSIADAQIVFKGLGVVADKQKPGLLTRILQWLF